MIRLPTYSSFMFKGFQNTRCSYTTSPIKRLFPHWNFFFRSLIGFDRIYTVQMLHKFDVCRSTLVWLADTLLLLYPFFSTLGRDNSKNPKIRKFCPYPIRAVCVARRIARNVDEVSIYVFFRLNFPTEIICQTASVNYGFPFAAISSLQIVSTWLLVSTCGLKHINQIKL